MANPECMFNPEKSRSFKDKLEITCAVAGCAISGLDRTRLATAGGDYAIIDSVRAKAAPDCELSQPPEPLPVETQPPAEQ